MLFKGFDEFWLVERNELLSSVAKNAPVSLSKCVKITVLRDGGGVAQTNPQFFDFEVVEGLNPSRQTFWHFELDGRGACLADALRGVGPEEHGG